MRISVSMKKIIVHKINAATPRLSDEEVDPIEQDDGDGITTESIEGFVLWSSEDILDVHKLIAERLEEKEREILVAFMEGYTYMDIEVTEKYWRYHFNKGIELIRKELGL